MKLLRVSMARCATLCARRVLFFAPALALAMISGAQPAAARTWYVSATAAAGGNGSSDLPFNTLALVQQASGAGDTILVLPSPASTPPLDGGIALKPGQRLLGAGPPVLRFNPSLIPGGPPVVGPSGLASLPRVSNTSEAANSGDAIELADSVSVENLVITAAYRGAIYGHDVMDATVRGNDVSGFNSSGTTGFVVQPFYLESYAAGSALDVANGIPAGWAALLFDTSRVTASLAVSSNYIHDGVCGDGIDIRGMGTGKVTAQVNYNFVTRLPQCSSIRTMEGIGTQVTGTSVLHASLFGNTEAYNGSAGANADSLFVNPAEAGILIETIWWNYYTTGIGGPSTNGFEYIVSNGSGKSSVVIGYSTFENNPGDMLEEFNRGESGTTAELTLDHVIVNQTTFSGGVPSYANPPGTASTPDNTGECLGIGSVGANDVTILRMTNSQFTGCDNNGIEVTNNHPPGDGNGNPHTVVLDIDHSRISGSRYYNLWVDDVTPLTVLKVRVQDSDLSNSVSGVAVAFDQQPTGGTLDSAIDLGGGPLGSRGGNCIYGGAILDLEATGYNVYAENDWWASASGPQSGKVSTNSPNFTVYDRASLARAPTACTLPTSPRGR